MEEVLCCVLNGNSLKKQVKLKEGVESSMKKTPQTIRKSATKKVKSQKSERNQILYPK